MRTRSVLSLVGMLTLVAAPSARAQEPATKAPIAQKQVVSASPFLWMHTWFNAEYERAVTPAVTLGASGSFRASGDYKRASFHARYYPQRTALTGLYLGVQAGVHGGNIWEGNRLGHAVSFGAGWDIGYAWLSGPNRSVALNLGVGSTRLFGGDLKSRSFVIPNVRLLNIGMAF